jgi:signal transduction histidine kinase
MTPMTTVSAYLWFGLPEKIFTHSPRVFANTWFDALCTLLVLSVVLMMHVVWRRRVAEDKLRLQQECRESERNRIANDIHDTLLQSLQGLLIHVKLAADTLPADTQAKAMLDISIDLAEQALVEGRDRIASLHAENVEPKNCVGILEKLGNQLASIHNMGFVIWTVGIPYEFDTSIWDDVLNITRESMLNAFKHSRGKQVAVQVCHERLFTKIRVIDDGVGLSADTLNQGNTLGHWGLVTMKQRAETIGATLTLGKYFESGTIMVLTVPHHLDDDLIGVVLRKIENLGRR